MCSSSDSELRTSLTPFRCPVLLHCCNVSLQTFGSVILRLSLWNNKTDDKRTSLFALLDLTNPRLADLRFNGPNSGAGLSQVTDIRVNGHLLLPVSPLNRGYTPYVSMTSARLDIRTPGRYCTQHYAVSCGMYAVCSIFFLLLFGHARLAHALHLLSCLVVWLILPFDSFCCFVSSSPFLLCFRFSCRVIMYHVAWCT